MKTLSPSGQGMFFTVSADIDRAQAEKIAKELANPVLQYYKLGETAPGEVFDFDWVVAVGYRPGVTDNVGRTAREAVGDIIGTEAEPGRGCVQFDRISVSGARTDGGTGCRIARGILANELIETVRVLSRAEVEKNGMPLNNRS